MFKGKVFIVVFQVLMQFKCNKTCTYFLGWCLNYAEVLGCKPMQAYDGTECYPPSHLPTDTWDASGENCNGSYLDWRSTEHWRTRQGWDSHAFNWWSWNRWGPWHLIISTTKTNLPHRNVSSQFFNNLYNCKMIRAWSHSNNQPSGQANIIHVWVS